MLCCMPTPKKGSSRKTSPTRTKRNPSLDGSFPEALAELLRSRKIGVPKGLEDAPPEAYVGQPVSVVEQLASRPDEELARFAEKVAGYAERQHARAKERWDTSPLIVELRRRKLKEPPMPPRVVSASVSLVKPLKEWSDAEITRAVKEWVARSS